MSSLHTSLLRLARGGNDLTVRQLCVLLECRGAPRTVRSLAESINISKPAITRAVDKLQELGYLERREDPDDRRSVLISLRKPGMTFTTSLVSN